MKTLLLPKILANEKRRGLCKPPPLLSFSADAPPPHPGFSHSFMLPLDMLS